VPWGNAAGPCKDSSTAFKFAQLGMPIVPFCSITAKARAGNAGDNFYYDESTGNSINALGLPNRGIDDYLPTLTELRKTLNSFGSKLCVSISAGDAFDSEEYYDMAKKLREAEAADSIEGNFSCTNVEVDGKRKPVVCFDREAFKDGVVALRDGAGRTPITVKIAPITEARLLSDLVAVCVERKVEYLVAANTIGNGYLENARHKPAIAMKRGGLAGALLKPIVQGMVQMIAPMLKETNTKLIAVGGIHSGRDMYEDLCMGAHGFAFITMLSANNNNADIVRETVIGRVGTTGLLDLMVEHGLPN